MTKMHGTMTYYNIYIKHVFICIYVFIYIYERSGGIRRGERIGKTLGETVKSPD